MSNVNFSYITWPAALAGSHLGAVLSEPDHFALDGLLQLLKRFFGGLHLVLRRRKYSSLLTFGLKRVLSSWRQIRVTRGPEKPSSPVGNSTSLKLAIHPHNVQICG